MNISTESQIRQNMTVAPDGCWIWNRSLHQGYGRLRVGPKQLQAHRLSYAAFVGPIPDGMTVDHLCFRTSCVNPEHLQLLTRRENARNQRSAHKTHCKNGHEFTPGNTYLRPISTTGAQELGSRQCRRCNADAVARYNAKRRPAA